MFEQGSLMSGDSFSRCGDCLSAAHVPYTIETVLLMEGLRFQNMALALRRAHSSCTRVPVSRMKGGVFNMWFS
eukprot:3632041-Pyramimonas_sp.AAC.1